MIRRVSPRHLFKRTRARLTELVRASPSLINSPPRSAARLAAFCLVVFLTAVGVRLLHWQDSYLKVTANGTLTQGLDAYRPDVDRILSGDGILFSRGAVDPTDASLILHPPGYSILTAAIIALSGDSSALQPLQIACDAMAAVVTLLIAAEFLPIPAAVIAGLLVAFSPHLAYYSLWSSPDSLAVLPILIAVHIIVRAYRRPRLMLALAAGLFVGLSCWLRSNGLLLGPFIALMILLAFDRDKRRLYAAALVGGSIIVIAPITVRNWVVYDRFIPLSIGAGITLIEGIADYDDEGRFAMPQLDHDVKIKDAEWHNLREYRHNLWKPDGVERDRFRFGRGLDVIRSDPAWFLSVMGRRADFMLSYNGPGPVKWPLGTAKVSTVSPHPTFGHPAAIPAGAGIVWSNSARDFLLNGKALSTGAAASLSLDERMFEITGDDSQFGDQFASPPIAVRRNTDYLLRFPIKVDQGSMAARVTSADRRVTLAGEILSISKKALRKARKKARKESNAPERPGGLDASVESPEVMVEMPFVSRGVTEVCLVLSNDGPVSVRPRLRVGEAELFELGPTPHQWTRYPRAVVHSIQKNVFKTWLMRVLVLSGITVLVMIRQARALAFVLMVPAYYLLIQSAFHTEYRYILAIHYLLFIVASVTLYTVWVGVYRARIILSRPWKVKRIHGGG